ncbi:hypothetical protein [Allohahella marinimesophila]|uniref:Uncharacterized protein n=1 Tax=Allohahella marinimesophila TaxID=1054972 RepID=A0ABP7PVU8_9GAMM
MLRKSETPSKDFILSLIVMLGLMAASFLYVIYSEEKTVATAEVWEHFKALSIFVAGYIFEKVKV